MSEFRRKGDKHKYSFRDRTCIGLACWAKLRPLPEFLMAAGTVDYAINAAFKALATPPAPVVSEAGARPQTCDKQYHMYVWTRSPRWVAVAQAENVEHAREAMLEEIGTSNDGSCPEREAADKWVRENTPAIFHFRNAEFALTDSAELREQELLTQTQSREIDELKRQLTASQPPVTEVAPGTSTGWLIERMGTDGPEWLNGFDVPATWSKDSLDAIRFSRRQDAEKIASIMESEDVSITEHEWA